MSISTYFSEAKQAFFNHMADTHNLVLLESEMVEIERLAVAVTVARLLDGIGQNRRHPKIQTTIKALLTKFDFLTPKLVAELTEQRITPKQAWAAFYSLRGCGGIVKVGGQGLDSEWTSSETWNRLNMGKME